jgi:serine phosphatase RsbU (regulator of sigma subunit)
VIVDLQYEAALLVSSGPDPAGSTRSRVGHKYRDCRGRIRAWVNSPLVVGLNMPRKVTAEELYTAGARKYAVFECALDNIVVLRPFYDENGAHSDFTVEYANRHAVAANGKSVEALVGRLFKPELPGSESSGLFAQFLQVSKTGNQFQVRDFEFNEVVEGIRSTGWFDVQATLFGDRVVVAYRNVTAQRDRDREWSDYQFQSAVISRAFLPADLPNSQGLMVAAVYLPSDDSQLGGDWYDAFTVHGKVVLVIGDVAGHGLHSAAVMGQLRNATRAYAAEDTAPDAIMSRLNRMICKLQPGEIASMIVAVWEPESGLLRRCSAGHPLVLRCRKGETEYLTTHPGLVLGVDPEFSYKQTLKVLRPDTTLLFYTDGLIESRTLSLDDGMDELRDTVVAIGEVQPQALCDILLARRLKAGYGGNDDICILAAQLG